MALKLRRSSASRVRLLSTLIAAFTLIAQPMHGFVASQVVNALTVTGDVARVESAADLAAAVANPAVKNLSIKASFTTAAKTVISRPMNIDGNGNTITFAGTDGWHGEYVFQAYKTSLSIKNLKVTGGDAALYANGSKVTLAGSVDVSDNEFGGIEVSQGGGVTTPAVLNVGSATLVNSTEATGKPTVWTDKSDVANAVVTGPFTKTTHISGNTNEQYQYYLSAATANIAATNTSTHRTYATLQAAFDDIQTVAGNTIEVNKDLSVTSQQTIKKVITLDGKGHTVRGDYVKTSGSNNSVIAVQSNGVTIRNITVDGVNGDVINKLHGINVYNSTDVALDTVTARNGQTGINVNGSTVIATNITTAGNAWHGINVDKPGAHLTIAGSNSHSELKPIYVDHKTVGVVNADNKYGVIVNPADSNNYNDDLSYFLKSTAPVATIVAPAITNKNAKIEGLATGDFPIKQQWFEITSPSNKVYYWLNFTNPTNSVSFNLTDAESSTSGPLVLEDGAYKIRYVATDNRGARSDINGSTLATVVVDRTKPTVQGLSLDKTNTNGSTVTLSGDIYDDNLLNYQVRVQTLDRVNTEPYIGASGSSSVNGVLANLDISKLVEGNYLVRAWATDKAGNSTGNDGISTYYLPFTIDRTAPVIVSSVYSATKKTLTVTTNEDASNVMLRVSGVDAPLKVREGATWVFDVSLFNTPGRTYAYTATATDAAGNEQTTDEVDSVTGVVARQGFTIADPFVGGSLVEPVTARGFGPVANPAERSFFATRGAGVSAAANPVESGVLGAQDRRVIDLSGALGDSAKRAAITPSAEGWKIFGFAWYVWLLAFGAAVALWWGVAAWRRRRAENA